jgi:alkylhydroperoxidase family enzyme
VDQLTIDFKTAEALEPRQYAMLAYAARLAKEPWAMSNEDVESLRRLGFSDRAILEVNLVTSYMSFVNRVAQGLGVELEKHFHQFTR